MCSMSALAPGAHWPVMTRRRGDRLEGQRAHERRADARHDRDDVVPALLQAAGDLDRLVGADAAGDAEGDERHGSWMLRRAAARQEAAADGRVVEVPDDGVGLRPHHAQARPFGQDDGAQPRDGRSTSSLMTT